MAAAVSTTGPVPPGAAVPAAVSRWMDLDGPVHYADLGGPADGPLLVCVHGLGGSHANWLAVAPLLTPHCRLIALDLPGFGLTRGEGRSTSLLANTALTVRFVDRLDAGPAVWVGNSMGALISMVAAVERPELVRGTVLVNPALMPSWADGNDPLTLAMFAAYLTPGVGQAVVAGRRRLRTPEQSAMDSLRFCCADPARVDAAVVRAHVELAARRGHYPGLEEEFVEATRSLIAVLARRRRIDRLAASLTEPVLLLHGASDRLVPVRTARQLAARNPSWRVAVAPEVGHVPQLEVPDWTAEQILSWLDDARLTQGRSA